MKQDRGRCQDTRNIDFSALGRDAIPAPITPRETGILATIAAKEFEGEKEIRVKEAIERLNAAVKRAGKAKTGLRTLRPWRVDETMFKLGYAKIRRVEKYSAQSNGNIPYYVK
jgi:hypothetical protein